jgi:toxin ParE1/3/4
MSGRYFLRPRARADLKDIWRFTESRWGSEQARIYTALIRQRMEAVAAKPETGRPCPELRAGYFKCPAGSHLLFYRLAGNDVEIVRILHQRMDFEQHIP